MELNKKNIIKLLLIIFISILLFTTIQNYNAFLSSVSKIWKTLLPFVTGLCIAFILNIPMKFFENKLFKSKNIKHKINFKIKRPISLILSLLLCISIFTLFFTLIVPEIKNTATSFASQIPSYATKLSVWANDLFNKYNLSTDLLDQFEVDWFSISKSLTEKFSQGGSTVLNGAIGFTSSIFKVLFSFLLGLIFSIYLLSSKEKLIRQSKKILYSIFAEKKATRIIEVAKISNDILYKFVTGQFTEALILGSLCFIGMKIFRIPYALTIASMITITALIPVVGALIGTIVGALLILTISPIKSLTFIIFILILQQIEGNIIYPKVVGSSIGLPGIWVLFSVTVGGSLFGAIGIIVSVPLCSILYCLIKTWVNSTLKKRNINKALFK